jgi:hypothetical protein
MVVRKAHVLSVAVRIGTVRPLFYFYYFTSLGFAKRKSYKSKERIGFAFAKPKVDSPW